jgi:hypothetical protein
MATTTNFLIPLTNEPQSFQITLGTVDYILTCKWNFADDAGWEIDFQDAVTGDYIASSIPLITGADLLAGLEYLGFQGSLYVYTDGDATAVPTYDDLGVESNLYFQTVV